MMRESKGTALITGGAKRIGRALVLALAEDGYDVAIHFNGSREEANATAAAARIHGARAEIVQADLTDREAIQALVSDASEVISSPFNVLINNASVFEYDNLKTANTKNWDRHFRSNLEAPVFLTQAFAAQFPSDKSSNGTGCVINLIDQRVRKLTPEFMTYSLAKSALWTFTQTAAQALAPTIRVNGIAPGPTLIGARQSKDHFERQQAATLLGGGSSVDGVVGATRFILASQEFTGQLLCVDGGQHLAWQTPDILGEL